MSVTRVQEVRLRLLWTTCRATVGPYVLDPVPIRSPRSDHLQLPRNNTEVRASLRLIHIARWIRPCSSHVGVNRFPVVAP